MNKLEFAYDTITNLSAKIEELEAENKRHIGLIDMLEKNINTKKSVNESLVKTNEMAMKMGEELEAENKKLREAFSDINDDYNIALDKLSQGVRVPRELSEDDLKKLSKNHLHIPREQWEEILRVQYGYFIKHFTKEGEE